MRGTHLLTLIAMLCIGFGLFGSLTSTAVAQEAPWSEGRTRELSTAGPTGAMSTCSSYNDAKGALFGVIVPCLSHTVESASQRMAYHMVGYMRPIIYAFLTLVVVLHGVTAVQGEGQMGPRTMLLLLKITLAIAFVEAVAGNVPQLAMISDLFDIMEDTEDIMAGAMLPPDPARGFACEWRNYMPSQREGHVLWAQMDCALAKVMGFAVTGNNGQPSMMLAASVLGMLGGFFFGGTFGLAVFFAAVGFIISLLMFVVRVGFAYINAYMVVAFYMVIAPIFIPLLMMRSTTQYFQNWVKGLLGAMITPVVVTAYSLFALMIFDQMLFRENSAFKEVFNYKHIADAQRDSKYANIGTLLNDQFSLSKRSDVASQQGGGAMATRDRDPLMAAFTGATNIQVPMTNLEIARAKLSGMTGDAVKDEKRIYTDLMISLAKLFILAFIVVSGWKQVNQVLLVLSGSAVAPMALGPISPMERSVQNSISQARAAMNQEMMRPTKEGEVAAPGGAAGTAFVERLLPTVGVGAKTFVERIGR